MPDRQSKVATAVEMASRQREISVSEFFLKNRHLLGFDTPAKALITAVKEAVDNALDGVVTLSNDRREAARSRGSSHCSSGHAPRVCGRGSKSPVRSC